MYVPHELFNRIDQEYMCREHIQCIIKVLLIVPQYMCVSVVCMWMCVCMCVYVYAVDRLHDLSGETENCMPMPGLVREKA